MFKQRIKNWFAAAGLSLSVLGCSEGLTPESTSEKAQTNDVPIEVTSVTASSQSSRTSESNSSPSVQHSRSLWLNLSDANIKDGKAEIVLNRQQLALVGDKNKDIEVAIIDQEGRELAYTRSSPEDVTIKIPEHVDPEKAQIVIRDNEKTDQPLIGTSGEVPFQDESARVKKHGNVLLKNIIVLARECRANSSDGMSVDISTAPEGFAYVQPFVFLAEVQKDGVVIPLSNAVVKVETNDQSWPLSTLANLPLSTFREYSSLDHESHVKVTRNFYQHYFSAAGEMYTIAQFRKQSSCSGAPLISVADALAGNAWLSIVDNSVHPAIEERIEIRPTIQPAFSTYLSVDQKMNDWTQCTLDRKSGLPKTYNGDAETCKMFALEQPPLVKLDYLLPSQADASVPVEMDPTRLVFYGHAVTKELVQKVIENASELKTSAAPALNLEGCAYAGGLTSVPLDGESYQIPLTEMNVQIGDVINTARRSGAYTRMNEFFQGNLDLAASIRLPMCIPGTSHCDEFRQVDVKMGHCPIKADSGNVTTSIASTFVYPDYFEISGVITE